MGRTVDVKEIRLVLMVEPELINRIEDYRYSNRIPSRSETIRRLLEDALTRAERVRDDEQE